MKNLYEITYTYVFGEVADYSRAPIFTHAKSEKGALNNFRHRIGNDFKYCKDITISVTEEMSAITTENIKGDVDMTNLIAVDTKTMENLEGKTMEQLKDICRLVGLNGFSNRRKNDLISHMRRFIKTTDVPEIITVTEITTEIDKSSDEIAITTVENKEEMVNVLRIRDLNGKTVEEAIELLVSGSIMGLFVVDGKVVVDSKFVKPNPPAAKNDAPITKTQAPTTNNNEIIDSLMRAISHPTKIGKFSTSQGRFMQSKKIASALVAELGIELKKGEFALPGYSTTDSKYSFICTLEGVQAVVKSGKNALETIWTPASGAFQSKKKEVKVDKVKAERKYTSKFDWRSFKDITVVDKNYDAKIIIYVGENKYISGTVITNIDGKDINIAYKWDQSKYPVPNVTIDKVKLAANDHNREIYQELVCKSVALYRAALTAEKNEVVKEETPVVTNQTTTIDNDMAEAAISKEATPKSKESTMSKASLFNRVNK